MGSVAKCHDGKPNGALASNAEVVTDAKSRYL
jgi:hypothetical protein